MAIDKKGFLDEVKRRIYNKPVKQIIETSKKILKLKKK